MSREQEFGEFVSSRASPLHRSAYLLCGDWHLAGFGLQFGRPCVPESSGDVP